MADQKEFYDKYFEIEKQYTDKYTKVLVFIRDDFGCDIYERKINYCSESSKLVEISMIFISSIRGIKHTDVIRSFFTNNFIDNKIHKLLEKGYVIVFLDENWQEIKIYLQG